MRVFLLLHPSLSGSEYETPSRTLFALPDSLTLVSDLHHFLHARLRLPAVALRLAVDGFALPPAQCLPDVLRDGDLLGVQPASPLPSPRKRARDSTAAARKQPLLALQDSSCCVAAQEEVDDPGLGVSKRLRSDRQSKGKGKGKANGMAALPMPKRLFEADPAQAEAVAIDHSKKATISMQPTERMVDLGGFDKGTSASSPTLAAPHLSSAEPWPDPTMKELWKPIAREPLPWELISFRVASPAGLSAPRAARVVGIENAKDGDVYVLIGSAGAIDRLPAHRLLQLSVPRSAGAPRRPAAAAKHSKPSRDVVDLRHLGPPAKQTMSSMSERPTSIGHSDPEPSMSATCIAGVVAQLSGVSDYGITQTVTGHSILEITTAVASAHDSSDSESGLSDEPPPPSHVPPCSAAVASFAAASAAAAPHSVGTAGALPSTQKPWHLRNKLAQAESEPELGKRMDPEKLNVAVRRQVEFYFGTDSYAKDQWLRDQGDYEGWTSLRLVAKFNRMRELTRDFDLVRRCCQDTEVVEISNCGEWVRQNPAISLVAKGAAPVSASQKGKGRKW